MCTERWMLAVTSVVLDLVLPSCFILSSQAAPYLVCGCFLTFHFS